MQKVARVAKAIAGAAATAAGGMGTAWVVVPPNVDMPWWGYLIAGIVNAGLGFAFVYFAPANRPPA